MKAFAYTAFSKEGKSRRGTVIADTETQAAAQLSAQGLFVSELTPKPARASGRLARRAALSADLQAVMTRQMAVLLEADVPVDEALEAVRQGGHPALETVAARTRAQLMDGAALSEALDTSGAGFPPYYVASVRAGETAGNLAGVYAELATHLENQREDKAQISTALIYPAFVALVSLLVCAILMVNVAPEIVAMFETSERPLPGITRTILGISDWIQTHIALIAVALAGCVALGVASATVPALRRMRDSAFLRLPLVGRFMRLAASVQYLRTLALVLGSKNTVPSAVENAQDVLTVAAFRTQGDAVAGAIRRGESLSQALTHLAIIPPVARQLVQAGEASARIAAMTERAAILVESGLSTERKRIAAILEPALMMLVGAFVLIVVLAVLLPIFELQSIV